MRLLRLITLRKVLHENLSGGRSCLWSSTELLLKDIFVFFHIKLQDIPELPLMICPCYLSKPGLQALSVSRLLHHLWAMSVPCCKLISFNSGEPGLNWENSLWTTMRYNVKILDVPQNLSLRQDTAMTLTQRPQTTANKEETYFTSVIMARKWHFTKRNKLLYFRHFQSSYSFPF